MWLQPCTCHVAPALHMPCGFSPVRAVKRVCLTLPSCQIDAVQRRPMSSHIRVRSTHPQPLTKVGPTSPRPCLFQPRLVARSLGHASFEAMYRRLTPKPPGPRPCSTSCRYCLTRRRRLCCPGWANESDGKKGNHGNVDHLRLIDGLKSQGRLLYTKQQTAGSRQQTADNRQGLEETTREGSVGQLGTIEW